MTFRSVEEDEGKQLESPSVRHKNKRLRAVNIRTAIFTNHRECILRDTPSIAISISDGEDEDRSCQSVSGLCACKVRVRIPFGWLTCQVRPKGFVPMSLMVGILLTVNAIM